jgi:hypothetical protein
VVREHDRETVARSHALRQKPVGEPVYASRKRAESHRLLAEPAIYMVSVFADASVDKFPDCKR